MTDEEKLRHDIDGLKRTVHLGWQDTASKQMTRQQRSELREHIQDLIAELAALAGRLG